MNRVIDNLPILETGRQTQTDVCVCRKKICWQTIAEKKEFLSKPKGYSFTHDKLKRLLNKSNLQYV